MRVLLTGGAGYIGAHTMIELLEAGYDVVSVDNYVNSKPEAIRRVMELTGKRVAAYELDMCDKEMFRRVFEEQAIDAVIHFAALKAVAESVEKPLEYYRNNLDSTLTLLELMREYAVKRLVFSSSATVYGDIGVIEYTEDLPTGTATSNPYGWTKCMIEQIVKDYAHTDGEFKAVLLRYFNPVGAHKSGRIGEDPKGIPNNLMPRILKVATGEYAALGLYGVDYPTADGTCVRDYIHVVDVAKGHMAALNYIDKVQGADAINLGSGVGISVKELVETFERVTGIPIPMVVEPRRAGDLPAFYANPGKANRVMGWKTEKTLDEMCFDAWNWQSKNPNGYEE